MARAGQHTAEGVYERSKSMPDWARRLRLGVWQGERPAMVAHCCWSDMMWRMLGRFGDGAFCARAETAAAPPMRSRRLIMAAMITRVAAGEGSCVGSGQVHATEQ